MSRNLERATWQNAKHMSWTESRIQNQNASSAIFVLWPEQVVETLWISVSLSVSLKQQQVRWSKFAVSSVDCKNVWTNEESKHSKTPKSKKFRWIEELKPREITHTGMNSNFFFFISFIALIWGWSQSHGSSLGCHLKAKKVPIFLASGKRGPCGPKNVEEIPFLFSFITPGFVPRVASVKNCTQQCGYQNSKRNPIFPAGRLGKGGPHWEK